MRIRQADYLAGITWIGENFLIAGDARIENDFSPAARPLNTRPSSSAKIARASGSCVSGSSKFHRDAAFTVDDIVSDPK
jgi:hypothetical protein